MCPPWASQGPAMGTRRIRSFPKAPLILGQSGFTGAASGVPPRSRLHSRAHLPSHTWPCPAATLRSLKGERAGSVCQALPALPALTTGRLAQPWEEGPPLRTGFSRSVATAVF